MSVFGKIYTFTTGEEFVVNPRYAQMWAIDGYTSKEEGRRRFKLLLSKGLTYETWQGSLHGFERALPRDYSDTPVGIQLDWRDNLVASK